MFDWLRKRLTKTPVEQWQGPLYKDQTVSLYGGLIQQRSSLVGGIIAFVIAEAFANLVCSVIESSGPPGYSYSNDWQGKRRLSLFKWASLHRQRMKGHNRQGRISLKSLGWRIV